MAGFRDLLAQAKSQITEIDTNEAASRIATGGVIVLDVRALPAVIAERRATSASSSAKPTAASTVKSRARRRRCNSGVSDMAGLSHSRDFNTATRSSRSTSRRTHSAATTTAAVTNKAARA